jgi:hypothetical protein
MNMAVIQDFCEKVLCNESVSLGLELKLTKMLQTFCTLAVLVSTELVTHWLQKNFFKKKTIKTEAEVTYWLPLKGPSREIRMGLRVLRVV